jgi:hypothetical protein
VVKGLRFRVRGKEAGARVSNARYGSGFRVEDLGFRVQGLESGFRVRGLGFRV